MRQSHGGPGRPGTEAVLCLSILSAGIAGVCPCVQPWTVLSSNLAALFPVMADLRELELRPCMGISARWTILQKAECDLADAVSESYLTEKEMVLALTSSDRGSVSLAFGCFASEFISCCINSGQKQIPSTLQTMAFGKHAKLIPRRALCEGPWNQQGFSFVSEQVPGYTSL